MGVEVSVEAGSVTLNGARIPLVGVDPHTNALDWIRAQGLTGAKEGCAEGECGSCAILVARPGLASPTQWIAINACLIPALALEGQEIVTVEGLGTPDALHPVQRELAERGGSQCGYCTPGFVCSMAAEYYRPDRAGAVAEDSSAPAPTGFDLDALVGTELRRFVELGLLADDGHRVALTREGLFVSDSIWPSFLRV